MTRLTRHAALLLTLSLLTSAATAYAECAWVLWKESTGTTQPWQAVGAWADQSKCESERIAWYGRLGYPVPPAGASVELYTTGGAYKGTMRYACLPDTVDPGGPKGK
jgi:hypothetical protein